MVARTASITTCLVFSAFSALADNPVESYLRLRGCDAVRAWSLQFSRAEQPPFGKPHLNWEYSDYETLRSWIVKCMDPFLNVQGRRDFYLREVDQRLAYIKERQSELVRQQAHAVAENKRRQEISEKLNALRSEFLNLELRQQRNTEEYKADALRFAEVIAGKDLDGVAEYYASQHQFPRLQQEMRSDQARMREISDQARALGLYLNIPQIDYPGNDERLIKLVELMKGVNRWKECSAKLNDSRIPRAYLQRAVLRFGETDYLFSIPCAAISHGYKVSYSGPGWFSSALKLTIGKVEVWYELKDANEIKKFRNASRPDDLNTVFAIVRLDYGSESEKAEDAVASARLESVVGNLVLLQIAIPPR